jgi:hypothetical protein
MKLDPKELDHAHLRVIAIEAEGPALCVEYGVPDQGGTCLVYRFRIPSGASSPTLACRYLHDPPPRASEEPAPVSWSQLPVRLKRDVAEWLSEQEQATGEPGATPLLTSLREWRARLA